MASGIFTSQSPYLLHIAGGMSVIPFTIGTIAVFRPRSAVQLVLETAYPKEPASQKLLDNVTLLFGSREMFMGIASAAAWYYEHRPILGWLMLGGIWVTLLDGVSSRRQIGRGEWRNWSFSVILLGLGGGLLGWFD